MVAICGIGHIRGARLAHPLIRRDGDRGGALLLARLDMKGAVVVGIMFGVSISGQLPLAEMIDAAERRCQFPQCAGKGCELLGGSLGTYGDAIGIVQDITDKAVVQGQPIDEGAKADPLHYAVDMKFAAQSGARRGPGRHGATLRGTGAPT
ncbi:hypothetical protein D3C77_229630 [compost metagenome]